MSACAHTKISTHFLLERLNFSVLAWAEKWPRGFKFSIQLKFISHKSKLTRSHLFALHLSWVCWCFSSVLVRGRVNATIRYGTFFKSFLTGLCVSGMQWCRIICARRDGCGFEVFVLCCLNASQSCVFYTPESLGFVPAAASAIVSQMKKKKNERGAGYFLLPIELPSGQKYG